MSTTQLIPVLVYAVIQRAHDFLVEVFGFAPGSVHHDGDGRAVHGEVRVGDTTVWLHAVSPPHRMDTPQGKPASHGGMVVSMPTDQDHGQREYGVSDLEGHRWWFASPLGSAT